MDTQQIQLPRGLKILLLFFVLVLPQTVLGRMQATAAPHFSVGRGIYETLFQVQLSSDTSNATIRYTLDGTTPSMSVGTIYTVPIDISTTTPLRAIAYANGMAESEVVTHTYIFLADVIQQDNSPPGYPTEFAADDGLGPFPADYEMDPDVVNDAVYQSGMLDNLTAVPTLSIVTDIANLFDPADGIYYNPEQRGRDWERPNSVELIYPDDTPGFQVNSGLRIHGGGSRKPEISPKKSFRLYFRSDYGPSKLNFPLFDGEGAVTSFDKLVLKAGSNNKWHHWSTFQRPVALYMRDEFARRSQQDMGHVSPHGTFVHLYLNGIYWGMYNIVERIDDNYVSDYFGGDTSDWDVIKPDDFGGQEAAEGDLIAWQTLMAMANAGVADDADYQAVQEYLDVESLIDYMILLHYIENTDWPKRNWYAARKREPGTGFKFIAWDSELSLKVASRNIIDVDYDGSPARLFHKLSENAEFRQLYADRIYKHLFNDGTLTPTKTAALFSELTNIVHDPVVAESARWGDYVRDVYRRPNVGDQSPFELYTRDVHWVAQRDKMLNQYFPVRTANVITNYIASGHYPALKPPTFNQEGGAIPSGFTFLLDNTLNGNAGDIYYTLDGSDPREAGGVVAATAVNGGDQVTLTLQNVSTIKARVKDGSVWSAIHEATFIVAQDFSGLLINEIMYHPPDDGDIDGAEYEFIELLNNGSSPLYLEGTSFTEGISYTFGNVVIAPGEYQVLASNAAAFQSKYGFLPDGQYTGKLKNSGEIVTVQDGLGGLIDTVPYLDDPPWPLDPDGAGTSLELSDANSDNSLAASWFASIAPGGTPGAANSAQGTDPCSTAPASIVINEINYNSAASFDADDWVELYNPGATAVDLSGWLFQDGDSQFVLPDNTVLSAASFLVLVRDDVLFTAAYPTVTNFLGQFSFGLSGGGERIRLLSPTGCVVDSVFYDDELPWPLAADGLGSTLTLNDPSLDNSLPDSWQASPTVGGSPGRANFGPSIQLFLPMITR